MTEIASSAHQMISGMAPEVQPGVFVFVTTNDPDLAAFLSDKAISTFREKEGMSLLIPIDMAEKTNQSLESPMCCITLNVYSSLDGVGLTAAVATALAEHGIPCNMVAAYHHDHVFVPSDKSDEALAVLRKLQKQQMP